MRHPEQREDEAFIMNVRNDDTRVNYWQTKRYGERALANDGTPLPEHRPIFVRHEEIIRQPNGGRFVNTLKKEGHW